jgi:hypothetical protein
MFSPWWRRRADRKFQWSRGRRHRLDTPKGRPGVLPVVGPSLDVAAVDHLFADLTLGAKAWLPQDAGTHLTAKEPADEHAAERMPP